MSTLPYVPKPQLGPDYTSGTVAGLTVAANGSLTLSGDVVTFLAVPPNPLNTGRRVNVSGDPEHQEINAMNTTQRNQVVTSDGFTLDIQMFNVNNGNDPAPLVTLFGLYNYFFVTWLEGTVTGAIYTNEFYGVRGTIDKPTEGRGEQLTTAHFLECDPGYPSVYQYNRFQSG